MSTINELAKNQQGELAVGRDIENPGMILAVMQENRSSGFLSRSDINRSVQSQKNVRSLKLWKEVEDGLYYPYSENKGAD